MGDPGSSSQKEVSGNKYKSEEPEKADRESDGS